MSGNDEYKEIIKQCIGSVKEVFGEGRFDDVVASIMKMQEKVLASSMQQEGSDVAGQIAADGGQAIASVESLIDGLREELKEELRAVKRRILKLERAVYGVPQSGGTAPKEG
ncbi:hypothetical protein [Candidatus Anaplasma sp. TIGMIC]|uniref:hypothetical protein n=1 Tax=Candidatus Anaplasma sp. TIGMIC TaxID=3020713 RepID=UPI00232BF450|nr:hypothetical protein [Candidatus Anaplasma sp. TIGMIC]MDB1135193.1 hypothetical protein [Candidatus Anaplasma sp. TIGMIC]